MLVVLVVLEFVGRLVLAENLARCSSVVWSLVALLRLDTSSCSAARSRRWYSQVVRKEVLLLVSLSEKMQLVLRCRCR